jgi:sugar (glycoside-pentoside-hexuronide) transporter
MKKASLKGMISYGLGDLAGQFVWTFIGSYLTIFYTDIVGLAPAAISLIMLGARIWDAVNDPIMGAIAENTRNKLGRFRPWITYGCPILAVFLVLTFTHPFSGSSAAGVIWATVTYVVAGMIYTLVGIPYDALAAVMTEDPKQLNVINTLRMVGMYAGNLIIGAATAGLALHFSAAGATAADGRGYLYVAIIYGIISIPLYLIVGTQCKEVVHPVKRVKFSLKATFANNFKNKYIVIMFLINLFVMLNMMIKNTFIPYYAQYCLNNYAMIATLSSIPMIVSIASTVVAPFIGNRIGTKNAMILAVVIQMVGNVIMFVAPFNNIPLVMVGFCIAGWGSGGLGMSLVADAIDYMELKTGVRNDGTAYAFAGFGRKLGSALAGSVGVWLLSMVGYIPNAEQAAATLQGIKGIVSLTPFISGLAIIILLAVFWDLSPKQAEENRKKLSEQRAASEKEEA